MTLINAQSIVQTLAGWVYDFKQDNSRLPGSFDDLCANKDPRHDYKPDRAIKRNQELGYSLAYRRIDQDNFELKVIYGSERREYRSENDTFYHYVNDELKEERKVRKN